MPDTAICFGCTAVRGETYRRIGVSAWDVDATLRTCTEGAKDRKSDQECRIGVSPVHLSGGDEYARQLALEGESWRIGAAAWDAYATVA
jgi:hypothetical protein